MCEIGSRVASAQPCALMMEKWDGGWEGGSRGREAQEEGNVCVLIADFTLSSVDRNRTLYSKYSPIKNEKLHSCSVADRNTLSQEPSESPLL